MIKAHAPGSGTAFTSMSPSARSVMFSNVVAACGWPS